MSNSKKELFEQIIAPYKEKYLTGNYIIVSGRYIIGIPNWECFHLDETYIHKKDDNILKEFLKDDNVEIEYKNNEDNSYWEDLKIDFIKNYDENYSYRLKK